MAATTVTTYVQKLYQNILLRDGDTPGIDFWVAQGNAGTSAADIAKGFIGSAEAQNITAVLHLYDVFFNRAADSAGLKSWVAALNGGSSLLDIAKSFSASSEFQAKFATVSTADYVEAAYSNLFGRASDAAGKAYWVQKIDSGTMSRAEVGLSFTLSSEAQSSTGAATRFTESYLVLRAAGTAEPSTSAVEALAIKTLAVTLAEQVTSYDAGSLTTLSGKLIDGYIKDATIFADTNNNGKWDAGEATTTTDANGNFTLNGSTGTIIATGGTDISTKLPFTGSLTAPAGSTTVSPLTTLIQSLVSSGVSLATAQAKVLTALGLPSATNLLTLDPFADIAGNGSTAIKQAAAQVQAAAAKVINILAQGASAMQGADSSITATDAMSKMVVAMASNFSSATTTVDLTQTSTLSTIMTAAATGTTAATKVAATLNDLTLLMSSGVSQIDKAITANPTDFTAALTQIAKVETVIQGSEAVSLKAGIASGSLASTVSGFTGTALDTAVNGTTVGSSGGSSGSVTLLKGKLADGYVSGAFVFADANNNGKFDAGEFSATTDAKGDFTLAGGSGPIKGQIIGTGGTDLSTGKAFLGVLKAPEGSTQINPLTTLTQGFIAAGKSPQDAQNAVSKALGLDSSIDLSSYDPLAAALDTTNPDAQANGVAFQAAAAKLANFIVTAGQTLTGAAGGASNLDASTAGNALISAMVNSIESAPGGTLNFTDTTTLANIVKSSVALSGDADLIAAGAKVDAMANTFATMSAASATNIEAAVNNGGGNLTQIMINVAKAQVVAQGDMATQLLEAAASGNLDSIASGFTEEAFNTLATQAAVGELVPGNTAAKDAVSNSNSTAAALPPNFVNATVDGHLLVLHYSETLDNTMLPSKDAFTIIIGSTTLNSNTDYTVTSVSGKSLLVTLTQPVTENDSVTVTYAHPTQVNDLSNNAIQDADGNDALGFSSITVSNITDNTLPAMASALVSSDGMYIVLTYSETLTGTTEASDYTVALNTGNVTVATATIMTGASNNQVKLDLSSAIPANVSISSISYANQGTANSITDAATTPNSAANQSLTTHITKTQTLETSTIIVSDADGSLTYSAGDTITVKFNQAVNAASLISSQPTMLGSGYTMVAVAPTNGGATDFVITLGSAPSLSSVNPLTFNAAHVLDLYGNASTTDMIFSTPTLTSSVIEVGANQILRTTVAAIESATSVTVNGGELQATDTVHNINAANFTAGNLVDVTAIRVQDSAAHIAKADFTTGNLGNTTTIDVSSGALIDTVANLNALPNLTESGNGKIDVSDTVSNIIAADFTVGNIAWAAVIQVSDTVSAISGASFTTGNLAKVTDIQVSDTVSQINGANFTAGKLADVTIIQVSDTVYNINGANFTAGNLVDVTSYRVQDSAANIDNINKASFKSDIFGNITAIDVSSGTLADTVTNLNDMPNLTVSGTGKILVSDTVAAINAAIIAGDFSSGNIANATDIQFSDTVANINLLDFGRNDLTKPWTIQVSDTLNQITTASQDGVINNFDSASVIQISDTAANLIGELGNIPATIGSATVSIQVQDSADNIAHLVNDMALNHITIPNNLTFDVNLGTLTDTMTNLDAMPNLTASGSGVIQISDTVANINAADFISGNHAHATAIQISDTVANIDDADITIGNIANATAIQVSDTVDHINAADFTAGNLVNVTAIRVQDSAANIAKADFTAGHIGNTTTIDVSSGALIDTVDNLNALPNLTASGSGVIQISDTVANINAADFISGNHAHATAIQISDTVANIDDADITIGNTANATAIQVSDTVDHINAADFTTGNLVDVTIIQVSDTVTAISEASFTTGNLAKVTDIQVSDTVDHINGADFTAGKLADVTSYRVQDSAANIAKADFTTGNLGNTTTIDVSSGALIDTVANLNAMPKLTASGSGVIQISDTVDHINTVDFTAGNIARAAVIQVSDTVTAISEASFTTGNLAKVTDIQVSDTVNNINAADFAAGKLADVTIIQVSDTAHNINAADFTADNLVDVTAIRVQDSAANIDNINKASFKSDIFGNITAIDVSSGTLAGTVANLNDMPNLTVSDTGKILVSDTVANINAAIIAGDFSSGNIANATEIQFSDTVDQINSLDLGRNDLTKLFTIQVSDTLNQITTAAQDGVINNFDSASEIQVSDTVDHLIVALQNSTIPSAIGFSTVVIQVQDSADNIAHLVNLMDQDTIPTPSNSITFNVDSGTLTDTMTNLDAMPNLTASGSGVIQISDTVAHINNINADFTSGNIAHATTIQISDTVDAINAADITVGNIANATAIQVSDIESGISGANLTLGNLVNASTVVHTDTATTSEVVTGTNRADIFQFATAANQTIASFADGHDLIDLSAFIANTAGNTVVFGALTASDSKIDILVSTVGSDKIIAIDTNDNGAADFTITLSGQSAATINSSDFIFG